MTGRVEGKVALVTGAAKGQGRSHCVRLAEEGARIVAVDRCADLPGIPYAQGTAEDLATTAKLVEAAGGEVVTAVADVRDRAALADAVAAGVEAFGGLDVAVANAGVIQLKPALDVDDDDWDTVVGINLAGTWRTVQAVLPALVERGGGSVVVTSSAAGLKGPPAMAHYAASKAGILGMVRSLATEFGPQRVRVNCIAPTTVDTDMVHWQGAYDVFRPDLEHPTRADVEPVFASLNVLPVPWIEPQDTSNAVLWLASDEARYVTGIVLPVDAGTALT
ncbi:mycofactocin-coupled SDR family oxidoreductase [Geodermatophilus sp. SYSU D00710]